MENELYVVWMVRVSERARTAVGSVLGDLARTDLLRRLAALGQAEERLAELAVRIQAEFTPPELPAVFTENHLRMLVDRRVAPALAQTLDCPQATVLGNLLDADQLALALCDSGDSTGTILDPELLFLRVLQRLPRLAARHGLDSRAWGPFLEDRRWLTPRALDQLTKLARTRGWPPAARPSQILAAVLETAGEEVRSPGPETEFDALALIELRRRIGLLAEHLREEAMRRAEEAALMEPKLSSVSRLPGWLELYERNAVAIGLRRLLTGADSLSDLLQGTHTEPPAVTAEPRPDEFLRITNEIAFGALWKRRVAFDITCLVQGQSDPQVILRCRGLRKDDYTPIRGMIQQLRGRDLVKTGGTLGERLLNTQVAQRKGLRGHLRRVLHRHGPELIQCVVLTGIRQP
ncbi:hypothetical protein, partial [Streptomyces sp. NPDC003832]